MEEMRKNLRSIIAQNEERVTHLISRIQEQKDLVNRLKSYIDTTNSVKLTFRIIEAMKKHVQKSFQNSTVAPGGSFAIFTGSETKGRCSGDDIGVPGLSAKKKIGNNMTT